MGSGKALLAKGLLPCNISSAVRAGALAHWSVHCDLSLQFMHSSYTLERVMAVQILEDQLVGKLPAGGTVTLAALPLLWCQLEDVFLSKNAEFGCGANPAEIAYRVLREVTQAEPVGAHFGRTVLLSTGSLCFVPPLPGPEVGFIVECSVELVRALLTHSDAAPPEAIPQTGPTSAFRGAPAAFEAYQSALRAWQVAVLKEHIDFGSASLGVPSAVTDISDFVVCEEARAPHPLRLAEERLHQAVDIEPNFAEAHYALGLLLLESDRLLDAYDQFVRVTKMTNLLPNAVFDSPQVKSLYRIGCMLEAANDLSVAQTCYQGTLKTHGAHMDATLALGRVLCKQGKYADAVECFEKGLSHFSPAWESLPPLTGKSA